MHTYYSAEYRFYDSFFLTAKLRTRLTESFRFGGETGDPDIDFTGADITFGIGYNFGR